MEPTKEQIQWFWEQCGFRYGEGIVEFPDSGISERINGWHYSDKSFVPVWATLNGGLPPIDLNNLFKYAVPKLGGLQLENVTDYGFTVRVNTQPMVISIYNDKDPALALFWAIYKALGGKDEEPDLYAEVLAEDYGSGGNSEE